MLDPSLGFFPESVATVNPALYFSLLKDESGNSI
jgi:hypothetical protein